MGRLINRRARVIAGPKGDEGRILDGLRVTFEVDQTAEQTSNKSKINVWNLNETTRKLLQDTEELFVVLMTGYGYTDDILSILTIGDINKGKIVTQRQGADIITSIEIGDSEEELFKTSFNKTFVKGTLVETVIDEMAKSFGLPVEKKDVTEEKFNQSTTFSGKAKDLLTTLLRKQGLEFSIQKGTLFIKKPDSPSLDEVFRITPQTGLIGSPNEREKGAIELIALHSPKLTPGIPIQVESETVNGVFVVRKVKHIGDTHEGEWLSKIEAI